jgi:hypothetical protein
MLRLNTAIGFRKETPNRLKLLHLAREQLSGNPVSPLRAIATRMDTCIIALPFAHI